MQTADRDPPAVPWPAAALFLTVAAAVVAIRMTGVFDLTDKDQEQPTTYILDVRHNGHWVCQTDPCGDVAHKPPLLSWLGALAALPFGRINRYALVLPSVAGTLLAAALVFRSGSRWFGARAGLLAGLFFLLSFLTARLLCLVRTDAVFAAATTMTALAALRAWERGGGWTWFWLAGAAATLAKSPLGVVLGATGLLAVPWERHRGEGPALRGSPWVGLSLFLLVVGGWFALAYAEMGATVVQTLIGRELLGHVVRSGRGTGMGRALHLPFLYFLGRFAPWSVPACMGMWRLVRDPAADATERRHERFLFAWFWGGVGLFSLAAHQRGDLLFPLIPPAALIAGREADRLLRRLRDHAFLALAAAGAAVALAVVFGYYHLYRGREPSVAVNRGLGELADAIRREGGDAVPIVHVDTPAALHFHLDDMTLNCPAPLAVRLLRGSNAVYVAASGAAADALERQVPGLTTLARWPARGEAVVRVLSNRAAWRDGGPEVACHGGVSVEWQGADWVGRRDCAFAFRSGPGRRGAVTIRNDSDRVQRVAVRWLGPQGLRRTASRGLAPGREWHVENGG
jgi:4-amino-4-deoxy-L-arabinose transferase-like glycosyltransferase